MLGSFFSFFFNFFTTLKTYFCHCRCRCGEPRRVYLVELSCCISLVVQVLVYRLQSLRVFTMTVVPKLEEVGRGDENGPK